MNEPGLYNHQDNLSASSEVGVNQGKLRIVV